MNTWLLETTDGLPVFTDNEDSFSLENKPHFHWRAEFIETPGDKEQNDKREQWLMEVERNLNTRLILIPSKPLSLREKAIRVAQHEMGHYVLARALGFSTAAVGINIYRNGGHHGTIGILLPRPVTNFEEVQDYIKRRVMVLFAGGCAETLATGVPVNGHIADFIIGNTPLGAENDIDKAQELLNLLRDIRYPGSSNDSPDETNQQMREMSAELGKRSQKVVNQLADTIISLGQELANRVREYDEWSFLEKKEMEKHPLVRRIVSIDP
jgi:hypothetical protein